MTIFSQYSSIICFQSNVYILHSLASEKGGEFATTKRERKMPSEKRKSKKAQASKKGESSKMMTPSAFSKLTKAEQERRIDAAIAASAQAKMKITPAGRLALFIILPTIFGFLGLTLAYITQISKNDDDDSTTEINFDRDFIFPFILTLMMVIVIGFRTKGFTEKPPPLVQWPKANRKKKIIKKLIIWNDIEKKEEEEEPTLDKKKNQ